MRRWFAVAALCIAASLLPGPALARRLDESGSTLLFPLMQIWAQDYARAHPDIVVVPQATGSGIGTDDAINGRVQIGASDSYMSDEAVAKTPMLNIPLAISAQQVNYNIPGLNDVHVKLSGPLLAAVYSGGVQYWDDPQIAALNRDLGKPLPHHLIIPVHRGDSSGDTFMFTQWLSDTSPDWKKNVGFGNTVTWPSSNAVAGVKNGGMLQQCRAIPYSVAYIGISYLDQTLAVGLGYAALQNQHGEFVLPNSKSIQAAADAIVAKTPKDARVSLIDSPGPGAYPLINFEYAIVKPQQNDKETATQIADFLKWVISPGGGNAPDVLRRVHFVPLPESVRPISEAQIAQIR